MPDRKSHLRQKFNITEEYYKWLLEKQDGGCAICKSKEPDHKFGVFCVDHCHTSGEIRGLLCDSCNMGLGKFYDNIDNLLRAVEYIKSKGLSKELREANLLAPIRKASGQRDEGTKMDWMKAEVVRQLYSKGVTQESIAKKFNITQAAVSSIIRGKTWNKDTRKIFSTKVYGGKRV